MFSIEQRRSDDLHIKTNSASTQISYPQHHCEVINGDNVHEELNNATTRIVGESTNSALGLGVMRKKKSMYAFDTSCFNEATSFSGTSSVGDSSESSFEIDDGITSTPVTPTSIPPIFSNRTFVDDMKQLLPPDANNESQSHRQLSLSNAVARKVMEPHLRRARLLREESRGPKSHCNISASIASSMGIPYIPLRRECPFLFDISTYPLHTILAQTLGTDDLSQIHQVSDNRNILLPLLDKGSRKAFHSVYDAFVTSFCIPLLHSMAISKGVIHQSTSDRVNYRYQAFPNIHIARPGETVYTEPTCDSILGHSVGCLTFYIPLTPCEGSMNNCLLVESYPGKEDWHPLGSKSIGLGYVFDGTRCLRFDVSNPSAKSRVAIMFRVLIYRDDVTLVSGNTASTTALCPRNLLVDAYSSKENNSTFYDEAFIDLRSVHAVVKKNGSRLLDPSPHLGYPFA